MKGEIAHHNAIGSLTQLAAVGPQDVHIHYGTEDVKTDAYMFKSEYTQHTKFGIDISPVYDVKMTYGQTHIFTIPFQKQHILSNITLKVELPDISTLYDESTSTGIHYNNNLAYRLIKNVTFKIDGQKLDSYTGQYLYILHNLETTEAHREGLEIMTKLCECDELLTGEARTLYIPLHLWYSRTMKQFFPLLSLSKQKLELHVELEVLENIVTCENSEHVIQVHTLVQNDKIRIQCKPVNHVDIDQVLNCEYYVDYIAIDDVERDLYIHNNQTHVYNTVLYQSEKIPQNSQKIELHFNIPIKQLLFVITDSTDMFEFHTFNTARLVCGSDISESTQYLSSEYFSVIQNHYHNLCNPYNLNVFSYSFALNASLSEHNGAVHFGLLKSKILELKGLKHENMNVHIYARGYNVFHTQGGYGKIEFKV